MNPSRQNTSRLHALVTVLMLSTMTSGCYTVHRKVSYQETGKRKVKELVESLPDVDRARVQSAPSGEHVLCFARQSMCQRILHIQHERREVTERHTNPSAGDLWGMAVLGTFAYGLGLLVVPVATVASFQSIDTSSSASPRDEYRPNGSPFVCKTRALTSHEVRGRLTPGSKSLTLGRTDGRGCIKLTPAQIAALGRQGYLLEIPLKGSTQEPSIDLRRAFIAARLPVCARHAKHAACDELLGKQKELGGVFSAAQRRALWDAACASSDGARRVPCLALAGGLIDSHALKTIPEARYDRLCPTGPTIPACEKLLEPDASRITIARYDKLCPDGPSDPACKKLLGPYIAACGAPYRTSYIGRGCFVEAGLSPRRLSLSGSACSVKQCLLTGARKITIEGDQVITGTWRRGVLAQGTIKYSDGSVYSGSLQRLRPDGQGKMTWRNGDFYSGGWRYSKRLGQTRFEARRAREEAERAARAWRAQKAREEEYERSGQGARDRARARQRNACRRMCEAQLDRDLVRCQGLKSGLFGPKSKCKNAMHSAASRCKSACSEY